MNLEIVEFRPSDVLWNFDGDAPVFAVPNGTYVLNVKVDPFPAYAHDAERVRYQAERVLATFPIPQKVTFALLGREPLERTNGWTQIATDYDGEKDSIGLRPWSAIICLAAKRIPIHPAMTRYLVAHEYGHVIAETLRRKLGVPCENEKLSYDDRKLYAEYTKMRGLETVSHYGGGTWHARVEEIFANDFRILVTKTETEFWPHSVARPEDVPEVVAFWESQTKENAQLV